jgi:hypothetical protein
MAMIKGLLDGLDYQEQIRNGTGEPSMTDLMVTGVHVHHNFAQGGARVDGCGSRPFNHVPRQMTVPKG